MTLDERIKVLREEYRQKQNKQAQDDALPKNDVTEVPSLYMKSFDPQQRQSDLQAIAKAMNDHIESKTLGNVTSAVNAGSSQEALAVASQVVPTEFERSLIEKIHLNSIVLPLCDIMSVDVAKIEIPTEGNNVTVAWTTQGKDIAESDPTFTTTTINVNDLAVIVKMTRQLLQDNKITPALVDKIISLIGYAMAAEIDKRILSGGTGTLGALVTTARTQVYVGTKTKVNEINSDPLIDAHFKLPMQYRERAVWVATTSAMTSIRKLKTSNGDYLVTSVFTEGQGLRAPARFNTMLGNRIYEVPDSYIPNNVSFTGATSGKGGAVVFGDFTGYTIGDRLGTEVLTTEVGGEKTVERNLFLIRAIRRLGGVVNLNEKFVLATYDAS